jgi:topoisomerase-4 subunit A
MIEGWKKIMNQSDLKPRVIATDFSDALSERYLSYALSTIVSRSLPDVRDGLKPVHRRVLYAMRVLRLNPASGFKKCARVVGDVIGKFHPHGEVAVYDALVRLAQDFSARYPLVEGQGNFGNIDGDNAAAMRYTEARLTVVSESMLFGLDEDTVDFSETYDGGDEEPVVLPCAFPNLLANGANGVAVGMATSIPPHNATELCNALLHLLKSPKAPTETLIGYIPGPDFPTGGEIVEEVASIISSYKSGRGSFRLRATWDVEQLGHGQYQIIVTEIPYQVQKAKLIEKIADLIYEKKLSWLADVVDESTEDVRVVLVPRSRSVKAELLMEALFRSTELEIRVPLNLNVLKKGKIPSVLSLRETLNAFLEHRFEVLTRRTINRKEKVEVRLDVLRGYQIVYLNLDLVIQIIREFDEPEQELKRKWKLNNIQINSILAMRLGQLKKLKETEIESEHKALYSELRGLNRLLKSKTLQRNAVDEEIRSIQNMLAINGGDERRTRFGQVSEGGEVSSFEALVEREPITVLCSEKGWIRTVKGHLDDDSGLKYKEGDKQRFLVRVHTTDKVVAFGSNGRFYTISCEKIPTGRGLGEAIRMIIDLPIEYELVSLSLYSAESQYLVTSSDGRGFVVLGVETLAQTRAGRQVMNLTSGKKAVGCILVHGDSVALVGENHKLLLIGLDEVPTMTRGRGVILQRYREGGLSDSAIFYKDNGVSWKSGKRNRRVSDINLWYSKRGQAGRLAPRGFPRSNKFGS